MSSPTAQALGIALGDSLLRPVHENLYDSRLKTVFKPGATISSLTNLFSAEKFSDSLWHNIKFVWLLVGTNDIANGLYRYSYFDLKEFERQYRHLLMMIKAHIRDIHIVVCGIVPRLKDYSSSKPLVNATNVMLQRLCREFNIPFVSVSKAFCYGGIPQEAYFRPDRLHLSVKGAKVLIKCIQKSFAGFRADML